MNYRSIFLALFILVIPGMIWTAHQSARNDLRTAGLSAARVLTSPQEGLREAAVPLHHYAIMDPQGTLAGYIFFTSDLAPAVRGYGGAIPMAVRVDQGGRIAAIQLLTHNETPAYTGDLNLFVQKFIGKQSTDPLQPQQDVDAISGATISSEAVIRTIRESLSVFSSRVLGSPATAPQKPRPFPWDKVTVSSLVFGLCLAAILTANARLRWVAMLAGCAYFGLATATMLSIVQIANIGLLRLPDFSHNTLWWITLGFAFIAALILGRAYCSTVCPFALIQEILFKLIRRRAASKTDPLLDQQSRYLKYLLLVTTLGLTFILGNASAGNFEPFVTLFRGQGTKLAWIFLILMLIFAIFHFRFWCVYFCPVGALTGLVSRFSWFKIRPKERCSQCQACSGLCPVRAISHGPDGAPVIDESECILCGRCLKGCPEKKLSLRSRYEKT